MLCHNVGIYIPLWIWYHSVCPHHTETSSTGDLRRSNEPETNLENVFEPTSDMSSFHQYSIFNNIKLFFQYTRTHRWTKFLALFTTISVFRKIWWKLWRSYLKLPPGPMPLIPIFGGIINLLLFGRQNIENAKKYGPIYLSAGISSSQVTLNSSKLVKEIFTKQLNRAAVSTNPAKSNYHSIWSAGPPNKYQQTFPLVLTNGDDWTKRRKYAQTNLFKTMTNKYMNKVFAEAFDKELKPYLEKKIDQNEVWYPREICEYIAFNSIYHTMFGQRIERNCKLYNQLHADTVGTFNVILYDVLCRFLPFFARFKYFTEPLDSVRTRRNDTIKQLIQERVRSKDKDDDKSYIDYTHELVINGELTEDEAIADTSIMFAAGTDTTSSTLDFGVALMGKYQDVQERVRKEVMSIMKDGVFDLKLVNNCPLFKAFVHEVLRISSVVFLGVPHFSNKDLWVQVDDGNKYKIPKGTQMRANIEYIHIYNQKDENWKNGKGDGGRMILENFLDEQGNFVMNKSFIDFGVGRRGMIISHYLWLCYVVLLCVCVYRLCRATIGNERDLSCIGLFIDELPNHIEEGRCGYIQAQSW